jgi:hypothetical protein
MANPIGGLEDDVVRAPTEVAQRALAVFIMVCIAFEEPKDEILDWLREHNLYDKLAPSERELVEATDPSEKQLINAGWQAERLIVLCWALYLFEELPRPDEKCDPVAFMDVLPPFAEIEVSDFINRAKLRPDDELMEMAEKIMDQNAEARRANRAGTAPRYPVDGEIMDERQRAMSWIVGYEGAAWDDVRADT